MKVFSPRFLFSTLFTLPLSVSAVEVILDSNANFSGAGGGSFVPKETTEASGTTYVLKTDVTIANVPGPTGSVVAKSCFANTAGDLTFAGNGYTLIFNTLDMGTTAGAAISSTVADKAMIFTGFFQLSFLLAPGSTVATGKGAISAANRLSFNKNMNLFLNRNFSSENGGAITAKTLSLTETMQAAIFSQNTSSKKGGAVNGTNSVTIKENKGQVIFSNNTSEDSGAAIFSEGNITITDNTSVSFIQNTVTGETSTTPGDKSGGAICAYKASTDNALVFTNNVSLIFSNNSSTSKGGAICVKKLTLSSGGPTVFTGNKVHGGTTPAGGAIAIIDSGELSLSADHGDIIFENNTVTSTTPTSTRSAIDLGTSAKVTALRAAHGQSIFFYDPVTTASTTTVADNLNINAPDGANTTQYTGNIIFSGERLSVQELADKKNLTSKFLQPMTLTTGTLALRSGVMLQNGGFTQTQGSTFVMDVGTTLETTGDIVLTNLAININSINGTKQVKIEAKNTSKNVTVSGPIVLLDSQGTFYENHDLRLPQDFSLLDLKATGTVTHTGVPGGYVEGVKFHYGYQGTWGITWNDATTNTAIAKFHWTKTGYIPNPQRKGFLVPNSLWGSFIDISSLHQLMETCADGIQHRRGIWAAGLSNFFHKNRTKTRAGYRHLSGGYVLGASTQMPSQNVFSIAFCQCFARDKDYVVAKNQSTIYGVSLYYQHPELSYFFSELSQRYFPENLPMIFSGTLSYTHTENNLKTKYSAYPTVKGNWGNNCYAIELSGRTPVYLSEKLLLQQYTPFVKLQFVYAHQEDFKEKGTEGRAFGKSSLTNLAVPIGVKFDKESDIEQASYHATIAYVVDVIRNNPETTTTLLISQDSWKTFGTNLARQALVLRAETHYSFNANFEAFSQLAFELRGSSRNYNVDLGGKLRF
ncbi:autotransporter domain-containing protein [Candidatus Chlamydia sanziniae]|uniref:Outer membrane protein 5 n=1 Tax=Candidatus Chlamydia sanziniae TaxID=1806891 RepID=A0A1A9HY44_9CHLA|nr:autotransporter domain-containing protein [Candidatus Chlamydia sanziniae]ANH78846.1 outer membrane protein 5 [Candidatus Chlamydia sanziniae]